MKVKMLLVLVLTLSAQWTTDLWSQERISRGEYIETYADWAMKEMLKTGIPASIKLAQGCLESDNGNSRLARRANNHFGIKCHDWQGRKIYHDDDERNECFRSYGSAYESFRDHSDFLTTKQRYAFLFDLQPNDYKGWARGLKKAGYATSNKYAGLLIRIIEENELYKYDDLVISGVYTDDSPVADPLPGGDPAAQREIFSVNNVEYIIAEEGDTPKSLRREFNLYPNELYRYNHIKRGEAIDSGQVIFIQPKRFRAARGNETHVLREGETIMDVSDRYGIRVNAILRKNNLEPGEPVEPGTVLFLRKHRKDDGRQERQPPSRNRDGDGEAEMEFHFDG